MHISNLIKELSKLATIEGVIAFGQSLNDNNFIFDNCHPQLIFSNGVEQVTVWDVNVWGVTGKKPSIQKYTLSDFEKGS